MATNRFCTCGGYNENCCFCYGRGYLSEPSGTRASGAIFPSGRRGSPTRAASLNPQAVACPDCGIMVVHLARHQKKVHGISTPEERSVLVRKPARTPRARTNEIPCLHCGLLVDDILEHLERFHNPHAPKRTPKSRKKRQASAGVRQPKPKGPLPKKLSPTSLSPVRPLPRATPPQRRAETPKKPGSAWVACPECGVLVIKLAKHQKKQHDVTTGSAPESLQQRVGGSSRRDGKAKRKSPFQTGGNSKQVGVGDIYSEQRAERNLDGSKAYAHRYREQGRFGSHASYDDYGDESHA